mgnify:CR=1 FL=1
MVFSQIRESDQSYEAVPELDEKIEQIFSPKTRRKKRQIPTADFAEITSFIDSLHNAYNEDREAIKNDKPALAKISLLNEIKKRLRKFNIVKTSHRSEKYTTKTISTQVYFKLLTNGFSQRIGIFLISRYEIIS